MANLRLITEHEYWRNGGKIRVDATKRKSLTQHELTVKSEYIQIYDCLSGDHRGDVSAEPGFSTLHLLARTQRGLFLFSL